MVHCDCVNPADQQITYGCLAEGYNNCSCQRASVDVEESLTGKCSACGHDAASHRRSKYICVACGYNV